MKHGHYLSTDLRTLKAVHDSRFSSSSSCMKFADGDISFSLHRITVASIKHAFKLLLNIRKLCCAILIKHCYFCNKSQNQRTDRVLHNEWSGYLFSTTHLCLYPCLKKLITYIFMITSAIWTNFVISFTIIFRTHLQRKLKLKLPPLLKFVTALPCEK